MLDSRFVRLSDGASTLRTIVYVLSSHKRAQLNPSSSSNWCQKHLLAASEALTKVKAAGMSGESSACSDHPALPC